MDNECLYVVSNLTDSIWDSFCTNCVEDEEYERLLPIVNSDNSNVKMMQALLLKGGITNIPPSVKVFYNPVYYEKQRTFVEYIRLTNMTTYILVNDI